MLAQTMICPLNVFRISVHLKSTTSRFSRHALIMQLALEAGRRNAPVHSDLSVIPLGPYTIKQLARRADIAVILFVVAEVPMREPAFFGMSLMRNAWKGFDIFEILVVLYYSISLVRNDCLHLAARVILMLLNRIFHH
jgi:hypothetical protein